MYGQIFIFGETTFRWESLGLATLSQVRNSDKLANTTFRELNLLQCSGEKGKTSTLLGSLEITNLNRPE
jgi:hypothetical protein